MGEDTTTRSALLRSDLRHCFRLSMEKEIVEARGMFEIGDRVQVTRLALSSNLNFAPGDFGTVVGFSRLENCIRIKPDNKKSISTYHMKFWELIPSSHLGAVQPLAPQGQDEKMPIAEAGGEK